MKLKALSLRNFRNYDEADIPLSEGINLIHGKNGAGKTSLLEAIYLLSTGRSFITPHLSDLIKTGGNHFFIEAHFTRDGVDQTMGIGFDGKTRQIHYNSTQFQSFSNVIGILPSVLYSPKDSALISGAPQERRRFLNIQLAQIDPLYVHHLMRYHKAMKHRNALLKVKSELSIESWEKMMAESARYLMHKREELILSLRPKVSQNTLSLSNESDVFDLHYTPSISMKKIDEIERLLQKSRPKELLIGNTLIGPHRDDMHITYRKKDAKFFASEGQKRTLIAALKIAEWEELKDKLSLPPLFSIDDFGVHLDQTRLMTLKDKLSSFGQVLLTTPIEDPDTKIFIENGTYVKANASAP